MGNIKHHIEKIVDQHIAEMEAARMRHALDCTRGGLSNAAQGEGSGYAATCDKWFLNMPFGGGAGATVSLVGGGGGAGGLG